MGDSTEPATMSYVATMDSVAYVRVIKKRWRRQWRSLILQNLKYVGYYSFLGALSASVGANYAGADFKWRFMAGGAVFAAVAAVIMVAVN